MKQKKIYDPKKCQHRIIAEFSDMYGNRIALLAHHAFNWSIYEDENGHISITQMPREKARREYKKRLKNYKSSIVFNKSDT